MRLGKEIHDFLPDDPHRTVDVGRKLLAWIDGLESTSGLDRSRARLHESGQITAGSRQYFSVGKPRGNSNTNFFPRI